ncbi:hypothetical protein BOTBODRAFT_260236 [Botryobasidium botryosum FD-172 SS1]|uniref:Uncharacterized protein n=1 Tax=Botryobasidium botryosum (strain FD-172 SS1) TaxID=930990 RepID=A0A067MWW4_BOTB1|nr:hypothetical protein BOTBODRAFT_260236 [Botryobasidium botryosum FD-172 SS1]
MIGQIPMTYAGELSNPCAVAYDTPSLSVRTRTGSGFARGITDTLWSRSSRQMPALNTCSLSMAVFSLTSTLASALGKAFVPLFTDSLQVQSYATMPILAPNSGAIFCAVTR